MPTCDAPLAFLSRRLFLFSMIYGGDPVLTDHWISHYVRLGVPPSHVRVWIDAEGIDGAQETLGVLRRAGVPRKSTTLLAANWSTEQTVRGDVLNHRGKLGMVNDALEMLPSDAAIIVPDSDEFFSFPCDMEERMQGAGRRMVQTSTGRARCLSRSCAARQANATKPTTPALQSGMFCANFIEHIAASNHIELLSETPSIEEQFPVPCALRRLLGKSNDPMGNTHKVTLFELQVRPGTLQWSLRRPDPRHSTSFRRLGSSHTVKLRVSTKEVKWWKSQPQLERCSYLGTFPHYYLHKGYMKLLEKKSKLPNSFLAGRYGRLLPWMRHHLPGKTPIDRKLCRNASLDVTTMESHPHFVDLEVGDGHGS